ncbi:AAA family ATPase [Leadbetterella byssophila]|uniref:AAA family ATPase n=1 Tax=Leadbetterella byssophila TaxID=316068 RepID=UPI0039A01EFD
MKRVIIHSLTMRNFRGAKEVQTIFDPFATTISGRNGSGKSRHFDAFLWCLFGKDMEDRKDFNVKSVGQDPDVETSVSVVLDIDGSTNTLTRVLKEVWTKPKGQEQRVFKGNTTECYWNEVPLKVSEYESRVQGIIDATLFKILTNPSYFPNMKWPDQRAMLFQMAGTISDYELAAQKPEYAALLDKISGKSLADYKAQISVMKRKIKEELEGIQPRIDQTQKLMPEALDWQAIEAQLAAKGKELNLVDGQMNDIVKANRAKYEAIQALQKEKNILELKALDLINKAKEAHLKEQHGAGAEVRQLESALRNAGRELDTYKNELNGIKSQLARLEAQIQAKREEFNVEAAKQFTGTDTCVTCDQPLPAAKLESAKNNFLEAQKQNLDRIQKEGHTLKDRIGALKADEKSIEESMLKTQAEIDALSTQLKVVSENQQAPLPFDEASVEGLADLRKEIGALEARIQAESEGSSPEIGPELQEKKKAIHAEIDGLKAKLAARETIANYKSEIERLHQKAKSLGQELNQWEKDEFLIAQFTKAKIEDAEARINNLFGITTFKLFDYTIDGNAIEVCKPMLDGVEYGTINTAGKVAVGLDIIKALQKFHNAQFPIFLDGAESVNKYPEMDNQMIFLRVTDQKNLTVTYANELVNA